MARAFADADIVQDDSGSSSATQAITAQLGAGVQEGNAGIIVLGAANTLDPPEEWHALAAAGAADNAPPRVMVMCRADLPPGETTWAFPIENDVSSLAAWTVAEWTNVSYAPLVASASQSILVSPSAVSFSADQIGLDPSYTLAIAAVMVMGSISATAPWSPASWSNGFLETGVISIGTGQEDASLRLYVARRYGAASETGPWTTTMTFTDGAQTGKTVYGALAVLRAEHYEGEV